MRGVASAISTAMLFMQKDMTALDASSRAGVVPGMVSVGSSPVAQRVLTRFFSSRATYRLAFNKRISSQRHSLTSLHAKE
jgi:hypothetical protein